jgi:hypothetical protein
MTWAPDYCTPAELAAFVRINDDLDNVQLSLAIAAASRAVDRSTGRQFGLVATAETRYYQADYDYRSTCWVVSIDDVMVSPTLVTVDGTATTGYVLHNRNAPAKGRPWTELTTTSSPGCVDVEVTAQWGWSAVPAAVQEATLLQASRLLARRDSPYGVTGSPDQGGELRLLEKVDPDVGLILRSYRRQWWVA